LDYFEQRTLKPYFVQNLHFNLNISILKSFINFEKFPILKFLELSRSVSWLLFFIMDPAGDSVYPVVTWVIPIRMGSLHWNKSDYVQRFHKKLHWRKS